MTHGTMRLTTRLLTTRVMTTRLVASCCVWSALCGGVPLAAQDTIRVRSTAAPRWGADVKLTQVWAIGQVDGPDEIAFGRVDNATVDARGRMYVYDSNDGQIRQYAPDGKFVRNIGRKGKGPGEYEWVFGMDIADDSLLTTFDLNNARVSYFAPDGKLRTSFTDPRLTTGFDGIFVVDRRGLAYVGVPRRGARGEQMDELAGASRPSVLMLRKDGTTADSLDLPPRISSAPRTRFYLLTADGGNSNFQVESHSATLRSGGYVFGNGDAYRFVIRPLTGPVRVVERASSSVAVGSEERANWRVYGDYFTAQSGGRNAYEIPATKPVFRNLFTDHDNRIWVSLYARAQKLDLPPRPAGDKRPLLLWQQRATYDVFTTQGEYLARVELPARSRMLASRGNRLWVLSKGADDEDIIRLYTISGVK
ncbi:MAG: 6-bladed beta-propeller [Gemmatimonadaceae bacterium]|nr:6-bladed beta-propeller [Gemmatimonadaceae bacterium]